MSKNLGSAISLEFNLIKLSLVVEMAHFGVNFTLDATMDTLFFIGPTKFKSETFLKSRRVMKFELID